MPVSKQTKINWLIDIALFISATLAGLSAITFLFAPSGGYQGGRNPRYGLTILLEHHTWTDIHTWSGLTMIIVVIFHLISHWRWILRTGKKTFRALKSNGAGISYASRVNLGINIIIALSFLLTAISGIYLLSSPSGGFQGGRNPGWNLDLLINRTTWKSIHTGAGLATIIGVIFHFAIHWRWVRSVTICLFRSLKSGARQRRLVGAK